MSSSKAKTTFSQPGVVGPLGQRASGFSSTVIAKTGFPPGVHRSVPVTTPVKRASPSRPPQEVLSAERPSSAPLGALVGGSSAAGPVPQAYTSRRKGQHSRSTVLSAVPLTWGQSTAVRILRRTPSGQSSRNAPSRRSLNKGASGVREHGPGCASVPRAGGLRTGGEVRLARTGKASGSAGPRIGTWSAVTPAGSGSEGSTHSASVTPVYALSPRYTARRSPRSRSRRPPCRRGWPRPCLCRQRRTRRYPGWSLPRCGSR